MRDFTFLHQVIDQLKMHPGAHDQEAWFRNPRRRELQSEDVAACGMVGCLAGHAMVMSGEYQVVYVNPWTDKETTWKQAARGEGETKFVHTKNGWTFDGNFAREFARLTGLTFAEAVRLTAGSNTLDDIERIVKDIENKETTA